MPRALRSERLALPAIKSVQQKSRPFGRLVREHTKILLLGAEEQQGSRTQTAERERGRFRNNRRSQSKGRHASQIRRGDRGRSTGGIHKNSSRTRERTISQSRSIGKFGTEPSFDLEERSTFPSRA